MEIFITFMFWWSIFGLVVRSVWLIGEHPRSTTHSIGADTFGLITTIALLAWISVLKYGA